MALARLAPIDRATLVYLAVALAFTLAHGPRTWPAGVLTRRLLAGGAAWGTAFPSSHVAAALVAAGCAWRGWLPLGAVLVPAALLLSIAAVYSQLHHAVDALAGAALAAAVLIAGRRAGYHSVFRAPRGRLEAHGEAS